MSNLRYDEGSERIGKFKIDRAFEALLTKANESLSEIEKELVDAVPETDNSLVILCFSPRSGSTFLAQLMASSGAFNYVTNFIARFWDAPYFAGMLEKKLALRVYDSANELKSKFGSTYGVISPHEFGFFWSKWLLFKGNTHRIDADKMDKNRRISLKKELNALMALYDNPFFIKNSVVGLNPAFFSSLFNNVKFILLKRDPVFIAQSVFYARRELYGTSDVFWSTRPSTYHGIKNLPVYEQIARQVKDVYEDIDGDISTSGLNYLEIQYENIIKRPRNELEKILSFIDIKRFDLSHLNDISRNKKENDIYIDKTDFSKIEKAVYKVFGQ